MDLVMDVVKVPAASTQCGKLLRAMQRGVRLTIWNAMTEYGVGALHQRCNELRSMGWPIQRREIVTNGKRVAEFFMGRA
jgi:hypothetical protein